MTYPLVRELAADGIAVATTCRVLKFTPQGFCKWLSRPHSDRDWDDAHLINAIIDIHNDHPEGGYRFIAVHDDLVERDFAADGPNQVWVGVITEQWTGEGKLYLCT